MLWLTTGGSIPLPCLPPLLGILEFDINLREPVEFTAGTLLLMPWSSSSKFYGKSCPSVFILLFSGAMASDCWESMISPMPSGILILGRGTTLMAPSCDWTRTFPSLLSYKERSLSIFLALVIILGLCSTLSLSWIEVVCTGDCFPLIKG